MNVKAVTACLLAAVFIVSSIVIAVNQENSDEVQEDVILSAASDFVINSDGYLTEYKGSGGSVTIPSTVKIIDEGAFHSNTTITSVTIPASVSAINMEAFAGCTNLKTVNFPNSSTLNRIGQGAFIQCSSLTSVTIYGGVRTIEYMAFSKCTSLKSVTFAGTTMPSLGDGVFRDNPSDCRYSVPHNANISGLPSGANIIYRDDPTPSTYTVTYTTLNGTCSISSRSVSKGSSITLPSSGASLSGATLKGWLTSYNDYDNVHACGSSYTVNSDVTFYAYFECQVTFDGNGGTPASKTVWTRYFSPVSTPDGSDFKRDNYELVGWQNGDRIEGANTTPIITAHTTFKAVWNSNSYTVTFDAAGGKFADATSTKDVVVKKQNRVSPPDDPSKNASVFAKWKTESGDDYDFSLYVTSDLILTAQYIQHYTVSVSNNIVTVTIGSDYTTALRHTVEWGDGTQSSFEAAVISHTYTNQGTYAIKVTSKTHAEEISSSDRVSVSTIPKHTVTFNTNGGSAVDSQDIISGYYATCPPNPAKDGYTFAGWYSDTAFKVRYTFTEKVLEDITLHARWIKGTLETYTVSFESNGGTAIVHQTTVQGDCAVKPSDPTRGGYTFVGWFADKELTSEYDFNAPIIQDITLYASWSQNGGGDGNDKNDDANKNTVLWIAIILTVIIIIIAVVWKNE